MTRPGNEAYLAGGAAVFFAAAVYFGWAKLPYGFNFIDEGMYMTDGWRLAVGDTFFPDSWLSISRMFSVFNAAIFYLWDGASLLGFRRIQFGLCLFSMTVLIWVYRRHLPVWVLLLILAPFAFIGLDYVGNTSNLSYRTWPHALLILHVSSFILGLRETKGRRRILYFTLSGLFLWGIGFSNLPLSLLVGSPIMFWGAQRFLIPNQKRFGFPDLAATLALPAILWFVFIGLQPLDVYLAVTKFIGYMPQATGTAVKYSIVPFIYIGVSGLIMLLFFLAQNSLPRGIAAIVLIFGSVLIWFLLRNNILEMVPPYWNGWFNAPMWYSSLLIAASIAALFWLGWRSAKGRLTVENWEVIATIIPCLLMSGFLVLTSAQSFMAFGHSSIPLTVALGAILANQDAIWRAGAVPGKLVLPCLVVPFGIALAEHDWQFTFFDLPPDRLDRVIESGFARGIRTNQYYRRPSIRGS